MTLAGNFGDPKTERDIRSAKRFNFFALAVLVALVAAALWFYLQLNQKQRELEYKSRELADSTSKLSKIRGELEAAQRVLASNEKRIEGQLQDLSQTVEGGKFEAAVKLANSFTDDIAAKDPTQHAYVNLYAWRPDTGVFAKLNGFFSQRDYMVIRSETLSTFSKWIGDRSAVYYYNPKMKEEATKLASQLGNTTGKMFHAIQGAAHDAPSTDHDWLNVHYLGAEAGSQAK
jgi:hypothetical protein